MNRVESPKFPNTVCAVVKQPKQFSWYGKKPMTNAKAKLAKEILQGKRKRIVPRALFFTHVGTWFKRKVSRVIGNHRFYE